MNSQPSSSPARCSAAPSSGCSAEDCPSEPHRWFARQRRASNDCVERHMSGALPAERSARRRTIPNRLSHHRHEPARGNLRASRLSGRRARKVVEIRTSPSAPVAPRRTHTPSRSRRRRGRAPRKRLTPASRKKRTPSAKRTVPRTCTPILRRRGLARGSSTPSRSRRSAASARRRTRPRPRPELIEHRVHQRRMKRMTRHADV